METLNILFVSSEVEPFAKSGGLADVSSALPRALKNKGVNIKVVMPLYGCVNRERYNIEKCMDSLCVHMGNCEEWFSLYHTIHHGLDIYFIDFEKYFGRQELYHTSQGEFADNPWRFAFFCHAALQVAKDLDFRPNVVHCNDWQTALIPALLKFSGDAFFTSTKSLLTIHNIGYQGVFDTEVLSYAGVPPHQFHSGTFESYGAVNFLKGGIVFSDAVTTVSPTYSREICEPIGSGGLHHVLQDKADRLVGILNGVDYRLWSPSTDPHIPQRYHVYNLQGKQRNKRALQERFGLEVRDNMALFGFVGRFAEQKGLDLLRESIEAAVVNMECQVVVVGSGERHFENFFSALPEKFPGRIGCYIGYSEELAHLVEAGADFFLMPSLYEPCGLNQLYSLAYGTLPIVRETGGLADTVENYDEFTGNGTGFTFREISASALYDTIGWAVSTYYDRPRHIEQMRIRAMKRDFSWDKPARQYKELYAILVNEF
ncbi:glycogen synthase GlgA [Desulfurispira natronophila]|uniref:Glycogen synthase n=1 Tax=Desulfurispira natronophila TaxID=682562 RepID=A0A7W7Y2K3_9BACT|nr:glycogen synthase GlgA [Desulfurispira natronophila]MBB5020916.1 starch synthase [Desulfurispira natronophila]